MVPHAESGSVSAGEDYRQQDDAEGDQKDWNQEELHGGKRPVGVLDEAAGSSCARDRLIGGRFSVERVGAFCAKRRTR